MPFDPSPYVSVPQFVNQPAQMVQAQPAGRGPVDTPGLSPGGREPDIFERVVLLLMSNPTFWVPMMAGLGLNEVFKKSGKFSVKPHRSNEELAQQGLQTGIPGQTGMPSPDQMVRQLQPSTIGGLGLASVPPVGVPVG